MKYKAFKPNLFTKFATVLFIVLSLLGHVTHCKGKMIVQITDTDEKLDLQFFGSDVHVIRNDEASRFGLLPHNNCKAKIKYEVGPPYDSGCALTGDFHSWPNCEEVHAVYKVDKVEFVTESIKKVSVRRNIFQNYQDFEATINAVIASEVFDSIELQQSYSDSSMISASVEFFYGLGASMEHTWGESRKKSQSSTLGLEVTTNSVIPPNSNMTIELTGLLRTAVYNITYTTYVIGYVMGYYYEVRIPSPGVAYWAPPNRFSRCLRVIPSRDEYLAYNNDKLLIEPQTYEEQLVIEKHYGRDVIFTPYPPYS